MCLCVCLWACMKLSQHSAEGDTDSVPASPQGHGQLGC